MLLTRNELVESLEPAIARDLGSAYVASLSADTPRWFADGMGYWIASKVVSGADEMSTWESEAEAFATQMAKPDDFIRGQLPDDQAALVSYYFVSRLRSNNSGKFYKLLGQMKEGQPFPAAFQSIYGTTPTEFVGGQAPREGRRR